MNRQRFFNFTQQKAKFASMIGSDGFVREEKCSLHFVKEGSGENKYLVFHGFGQDSSIRTFFPESADKTYYFFDLFFHGKSEWNAGEIPIEKEYWLKLISRFLSQESIETFSLISFSIGSRFALTIIEGFPDRISSNILIAPDGLKKSFWYWIATYPLMTRRIFKAMINHAGFFHMIANTIRELRLLDKSLIRFAESQMNTPERRKRVYLSWVVFRHLTVKTYQLCELVNKHSINTIIMVGKNDKVITEKWTRKFTDNLAVKPKVIRLDCGHSRLLREAAAMLDTDVLAS